MTDYLGGKNREELEELLRRLISHGAEGPKVDFKSKFALADKAAQAELAKDLSSIANTDNEHLDDFGYIILGAESGKLVGSVTELAGSIDNLQAQITDLIKKFIAPVPQFVLTRFTDDSVGDWGVIIVPPSFSQPHLLVRDGASDVVKHEWWVRVNDTKERAGPQDYARFLAKAVRREVAPLEREVQRLALLIEQRSEPMDVSALVKAIRGGKQEEATEGAVSVEHSLSSSIRRLLVRGENAVGDQLVTEALRVAEVMNGSSERNPWRFASSDSAYLLDIISYLEEQTLPFAEALATVARYDTAGALTDSVCRALRVIAHEPQPSAGSISGDAREFRLYPLVLCLYALVIVGVNERRADLLEQVFSLQLERDRHEETEGIITAFRRNRAAGDIFRYALGKDFFEPVSVRARDVLMPRLAPLLAGTPAKDLFYVAEFVVSLIFMNVSEQYYGQRKPLPLAGQFFYEHAARYAIPAFLRSNPVWLESVLGMKLDIALALFDENAERVVQSGGFGSGFSRGAAAAYRPKKT